MCKGVTSSLVLAFEIVSAGLHCSFKMSRQMLPWLLTA